MTVLGTTYRLGSTSYVWPDELVPNVRQLGPLVDDVELVLFEVEEYSNLPDRSTIAELNRLAQEHDLSYTVHLPLDLALAHQPSLDKAERVIDSTRQLEPRAYVLHLDGKAVEDDPLPAALGRWQADALGALEAVAAMAGDPRRLCVENLENYPPERFLPLLDEMPVSLCLDIGHLWLNGRDPISLAEAYLPRVQVVHVHGIGERDHQSLCHQGVDRVAPVLELLSAQGYDGVLTLEVFSQEDFFSSRALVAGIIDGKN
jgi:sugar phosphate isomerase/epimerase